MGFLLTSILLSIGLTVLLNWGLHRSVARARKRQPDTNRDAVGSPLDGLLGSLFGRGGSPVYSYDEATGRWTEVTQARSNMPDRPDIPRR
jgi:hypothetical protein